MFYHMWLWLIGIIFHRNDKGQMTSNSTAYKLEGKIYKFTQDDDDDDEKKTWNGNSTQQM